MKSHDAIEDGIEIQASMSCFQLNLNDQEIGVNFSSNKLLQRGVTEFGCQHFRRRCRIRASCCNEVFYCRHCHNEAKNSIDVESVHRHGLPWHEVQKVTEFKCEGFIIGFRFNHVMFDGVGIGQLMKTNGELARGFEQPSVHPLWCRDDIPILKRQFELFFSFAPATLQLKTLDVSRQHINQIKNSFIKQTSGTKTCTTFEVLTAKLEK